MKVLFVSIKRTDRRPAETENRKRDQWPLRMDW